MSAAPASGGAATAKATAADKTEAVKEVKPAAALEEDDEFEDFPVESMCYSWSTFWVSLQRANPFFL